MRSGGILLHITSLPSTRGVGTLADADRFIDFLREANQEYWQILPVTPTDFVNSPYASPSAFAGNTLFIDDDELAASGLVSESTVMSGKTARGNDYGYAIYHKDVTLREAYDSFIKRDPDRDYADFCRLNAYWLDDYALFCALKKHFGGKSWLEWSDENARMRDAQTLAKYRDMLSDEIEFVAFCQYVFHKQWRKFRAKLQVSGIKLIGDIPIYVAYDSSDVWAHSELFDLTKDRRPHHVAGVPPDYFSQDGQLWGNPLYDWDAMKKDGYDWWIRRVAGAGRLFDIIRIDHFRGLESYWAVPYGETTAKNGRWRKGPGMDLVGVLTRWFHDLQFIAEDLGFLTPAVHELLAESGLPGMKVLEFAFDTREPSNYLPHTYDRHCVCYVGTHDNETVMQWREQADRSSVTMARKYLGLSEAEGFHWGMIRGGMSSVADTFVVQMQDCLGLGAEGRMNTPGILGGNWQWRLLPGEASPALAKKLLQYARLYGRI